MAHQAGAYSGFRSITTPRWMGCYSIIGLPPSIRRSTFTHIAVERHCESEGLAQEHMYNTISPARAPIWTARAGVERTNHEVKQSEVKQSQSLFVRPLFPRLAPKIYWCKRRQVFHTKINVSLFLVFLTGCKQSLVRRRMSWLWIWHEYWEP